jgi:hypothetical protein
MQAWNDDFAQRYGLRLGPAAQPSTGAPRLAEVSG